MKPEVTRREALVGTAAGLAALSLTPVTLGAPRSAAAPQDSKPAPKAGDYVAKDYSGILGMPGFSKALLEAHFTLYQGYVKNVNTVAAALAEHSSDANTPPAAE